LIDTVHVENVNVPSTRARLRRCFSILSSLVGSGGFVLGLNCIANRFCSSNLFLSRGVLAPNRRGRKQDKHRDGGATPNGVFHIGILSACQAAFRGKTLRWNALQTSFSKSGYVPFSVPGW
jgi:hypothetical protein